MNSLLVKLSYDGDFFAFTTFSRDHGHHGRFLISPDTLRLAIESDKTVYDKDIGSFIEMRTQHSGECDHLSIRATWLNTFADGTVCGIQQSVKIPICLIQQLLDTGKPIKYLYQAPANQAHINSYYAGKTIRKLMTDPQKRRALSKAMRDSFQWADESVTLYSDFENSFYFITKSGFPANGGLVLFDRTVDGHKGLCFQICT